VKLLIDSHALLWVMGNHPHLSPAARTAIENLSNDCYISVVSVWELATRHRSGKLPEAAPLVANPRRILDGLRLTPLSLQLEHARLAGSMVHSHKDPFDRMLAAQALLEGLTLVSKYEIFDSMLVSRLW
jgi:PIN domain nuclease of toxin-antitoxin system